MCAEKYMYTMYSVCVCAQYIIMSIFQQLNIFDVLNYQCVHVLAGTWKPLCCCLSLMAVYLLRDEVVNCSL